MRRRRWRGPLELSENFALNVRRQRAARERFGGVVCCGGDRADGVRRAHCCRMLDLLIIVDCVRLCALWRRHCALLQLGGVRVLPRRRFDELRSLLSGRLLNEDASLEPVVLILKSGDV